MAQATPSRLVGYAEACRIIRAHADALAGKTSHNPHSLPLLQCLGRVLSQPVVADCDQPPFARSTRDGFACQAAGFNAGRQLHIAGQLRAGEMWRPESPGIAPGEAVEIMTGAPVPAGADCVVMVEHVERDGDTVAALPGRSIHSGANIVPRGAEAGVGDLVLKVGTRMAAVHIAAAAACGAAAAWVFPRPRVAILPTGDELVEPGTRLLPGQIHNSNSYSLAAQALAAGADPIQSPIVRDDRTQLETAIRDGLDADLLLISGGVSAGKYDLVEEVLARLGAEFFFTGARIQPGKPVVFGKVPSPRGGTYFFGLPGNPVSTMVTFSLFVEPLLCALAGQSAMAPRFVQATLATAFQGASGLTRFLPALLATTSLETPIEPSVATIPWRGSGDLAATARANCFLVVPEDRASLDVGETVSVLLP